MLLGKSTVLSLSIVAGRCQNGKRRKGNAIFTPGTAGANISLADHDFFVRIPISALRDAVLDEVLVW
ncbi:hypothetical protein CIP107509_02024 [Corynebacterium diphtheriae]|nr:hypothetical protein CIP107509_02024 [Corynebacterium diphtheriae]CAB0576605.1 hypothetical protein CIP107532_02155 [Corynebacterium diphtheriae]CAB0665005.1 hypothetical protein CIP107572_02056 [Corynebacterium diphtheriae]